MMIELPNGVTRFRGDGCDVEVDTDGKMFLAFQKQNNLGCLVMVDKEGKATELPITPQPIGRPRLSCNPFVGLWFVGNQEGDERHGPPMTRIEQYTCVKTPSAPAPALGLAGVWQHEPNSIEVGGDGIPYAYIDLSVGGDYHLRLIVFADGRAEIVATGQLVIRASQLVIG